MIYESFFFYSVLSSFRSISPEIFFDILQEFSELEIDLRAVIEGFINQKSNLVMNVQRYDNNIVRVVKKPLAMPYNFITSSMEMASGVKWLKGGQVDEVIIIPSLAADEWFLINVDQFGFYRVNYDADNWRAIIEALRDDPQVFSSKTRAQLIDDALNLAQDGFLSYSIALDLVMDLKAEASFLPWNAAMRNLLRLNNLLAETEIHHELQVKRCPMLRCSLTNIFLFLETHAGAE